MATVADVTGALRAAGLSASRGLVDGRPDGSNGCGVALAGDGTVTVCPVVATAPWGVALPGDAQAFRHLRDAAFAALEAAGLSPRERPGNPSTFEVDGGGPVPLDGRHEIAREWCGRAEPRWVVRFCGSWVGQSADADEARGMALRHAHAWRLGLAVGRAVGRAGGLRAA